jgi:rhombotail lipoprotein
MPRIACLTAVILLAGCTHSRGFDRGELTRAARFEQQPPTDDEIARVLALRPQASFPLKLAVWLRPARTDRWRAPAFQWRDDDREAVLGALHPLVADGVASELITVTDMTITGDDLRAARLAAARHGADAVLVVSGAADVDRYNNWASLLYLTIVGLWVSPGTRADGIFLVNASLWDVRNEFLYASAEAEGTHSRTAPALLLENADMVTDAKRSALASLAKELATRLRNLRHAPAAAATR